MEALSQSTIVPIPCDQIQVEDTVRASFSSSRSSVERFYRVNRARSRELGGTGLGLLSSNTWQGHTAEKLPFESRFGGGTRFTIELPRRSADGSN